MYSDEVGVWFGFRAEHFRIKRGYLIIFCQKYYFEQKIVLRYVKVLSFVFLINFFLIEKICQL